MEQKRLRLPIVVDILFFGITIFALSYVWAQFFIKIRLLSVMFSIAVSITALLLIIIQIRRKAAREYNNALEKRRFSQVMMQFAYSAKEKNLQFFFSMLSKKYSACLKNSCILLNSCIKDNLDGSSTLDGHPSNVYAVVPHFSLTPLSPQDLSDIIASCQKYLPEKLFILTNEIAPKTLELAPLFSSVAIILKDAQSVYNLLKKYDTFPDITITMKSPSRISGRRLLSAALNRKRTKAYVFIAIVLSVFSFITPFRTLYLTFATISLLLAFLSFLNIPFSDPRPPKLDL